MRLLCLTDLHGSICRLQSILSVGSDYDAVLLGGDITHFGSPNDAAQIVRQIQAVYPLVMAVSGNCDSPAIDQQLKEMNVSLFGRGTVKNGVGFCGVSAMPVWRGTMYELTERQMRAALDQGYGELASATRHVILSHTPPIQCLLDRTRRGQHVGSQGVREFIEAHQPLLVVTGHIHEARGIDAIGATTIVNCGAARDGYFADVQLSAELSVELKRA